MYVIAKTLASTLSLPSFGTRLQYSRSLPMDEGGSATAVFSTMQQQL